jgi:Fe2+ or Zn2+ uptake regulation protein
MNTDDWLTVLRASGYRVTEVQEVLVRLFIHTKHPFSADEAWEVVRGASIMPFALYTGHTLCGGPPRTTN